GVHLLFEIMEPLLTENKNLKLHIVGTGPLADALKKQMNPLLGNQIIFYGWLEQSEIYKVYEQTDIFLIPSVYPDNFPIVCIEALYFGKPVIIFNVGGLPEMVEDGYNGRVIEPYNIEEMRLRLNELIKAPDLRKKMGEHSKEIFEKRFREDV